MYDLVVTRHPALVEFLREHGVVDGATPVVAHATAADVRGLHVLGVLPLHLAAEAACVTEVVLDLPATERGRELTLADVERYAGGLRSYTVEPQPCTVDGLRFGTDGRVTRSRLSVMGGKRGHRTKEHVEGLTFAGAMQILRERTEARTAGAEIEAAALADADRLRQAAAEAGIPPATVEAELRLAQSVADAARELLGYEAACEFGYR